MAASDIEWEPVIRFGDPVEQTLAVVDALPPCLVISASHGVTGFRRLFIGTVVERLSRALTCPMLVVKPGLTVSGQWPQRYASAVVTCDRHGRWQQVAPLLLQIQTADAACVHLVHVLEGPLGPKQPVSMEAPYDQVQQACLDSLQRDLKARAGRLFSHAHRISVAVGPGVPQEVVLASARKQGVDLVTVGVRRAGRMGRWLAGSTTEALLRGSPCSVLTVPEPDGGPPDGEDER
jgi:nucleotide-binding universal stress UspA family protein